MTNLYHLALEPFELGLLRRALLEIVLVAAIAAAVGCFVVLRGIAFIGETMSHTVLPGVAIAYAAGLSIYLGAGLFALLTIGLVLLGSRDARSTPDAAIGVAFAGLFPLGVILLSLRTAPDRSLDDLLFGSPLAASRSDLLVTVAVGAVIVTVAAASFRALVATSFDRPFAQALGYRLAPVDVALLVAVAATVVLAMLTVGTVLSLGLLVTPPAAARLLTRRLAPMIATAIALAVVAGVAAMELSYWLDVATGATIVLCTGAELVVALAVHARRGRAAARKPASLVPAAV